MLGRIDGKTGNENISECFKEKYQELYNGVNDNEIYNINVILHNKIQNCIPGECHRQHYFRDINMNKAKSFLKKSKKDHFYGILLK